MNVWWLSVTVTLLKSRGGCACLSVKFEIYGLEIWKIAPQFAEFELNSQVRLLYESH